MRKNVVLLLLAALIFPMFVLPTLAQQKPSDEKAVEPKSAQTGVEGQEGLDPDFPDFVGANANKRDFLLRRDENINFLRGFPYRRADDRVRAIYAMKRQEMELARNRTQAIEARRWKALGPAPIPNGQTVTITTAVSGRTTTIAVHPTNPDIAYVGTAQGGLYRTLDGGTNWTPLLDDALSLAIGSVAIAPSDPTIVFVGTGEPQFSGDSFFGVGIYRITNADTTPVVAGPITGAPTADVFTGRAVSEIAVHPTNPNILFASTTSGNAGIGGSPQPVVVPARGLYRTSNALAANPSFEKMTVATAAGGDRSVVDVVMEPGNPNRIVCAVYGLAGVGDGGIYLSTNALDPVPTFTQTLQTGTATGNIRAELAINKVGAVVTVYAATGTSNGQLLKSVDGGATWGAPLAAANGFCNPQCFYDIAVAVDPNNADIVHLGGSPAFVYRRSTTGGTAFTNSSVGLHVDTHAITVAPSNPSIIYFGSDGGIWKSVDNGGSWIDLNNTQYSATQFQSIALHPVDPFFSIGGTQDNGTEFLRPNNTWVRAVGGDGGQTVIDQNATDNTNVTMYHTFFNQTGTQIGFNRITSVNPGGTLQSGTFLGCGGVANGIACADATLFYAPLTRGPGTPNTLYMGTNKLYRSANTGTTMTAVSQTFAARVASIGISPQNDNVRIVGLTDGSVFATTTGSTTLANISPPISPRFISRVVIDPNNADTAYLTISGFGLTLGQQVWKTTNLSNATPTWNPSGNGIPDIPVSSFVVDHTNSNHLYAGTDIGVYRSTDGGANWIPFSNGLPRVAVFDMAIHKSFRTMRIATHGRGIYEMNLNPGSPIADFDGDGRTDVSVFRPSDGGWYFNRSSNGSFGGQFFGLNGDKIAPGDYDGDGKTDFAVFRPSDNTWYILNSSNGAIVSMNFGLSADVPVAADYDGDGRTDIAVFRPSDSTWYLQQSTAGFRAMAWGTTGDRATPGDYDGDGKADLAVFRASVGGWFILQSSTGTMRSESFGLNGDRPVAGDYDGDGKTDLAVFRPSDTTWYLKQSTAGFGGQAFGNATDIPAPGDYDGDGKADIAVFRPSEGGWYLQQSAAGFRGVIFGTNGDVPVPSGYIP